MLRQTLRSFESLMTMTYHCRAAEETILRDHLSERDSPNHQSPGQSGIRLRENSEFESREAKVVLFKIESLLAILHSI